MSLNGHAILQSSLSLILGLSALEAIRELPMIYSEGKISDIAIAKFAIAIMIILVIMCILWWCKDEHIAKQTPAQSPQTPPVPLNK